MEEAVQVGEQHATVGAFVRGEISVEAFEVDHETVAFDSVMSNLPSMPHPMTYHQLRDYILSQMRMSAVYQPVMLKVLLERDGAADVTEIAKALLSYDQSQIEYYAIRTKNMVGRILTQN